MDTGTIVIGDGILGRMISAELSAAGYPVTIVTGEDEAVAASYGSLVWLNVTSTDRPDYARLRRASMALWHELAALPGCPVELCGALLWDRPGAALETLAAVQGDAGWPCEVIGADRFAALAPGVGQVPDAALFAPGEGRADPQAVMDWAMTRCGATRVAGRVQAVETSGGRVTGVRLASGARLAADHVVVAAGSGSPALLEPLGVALRLRHAPGMMLRTEPLPRIATPVMASPLMDAWQGSDGTVMIATGTHDTMEGDLEGTVAAAVERLGRLAPAAAGARVRTSTIRMRPIPDDGMPVLGSPAGTPGLHVAVCHSGMTLAPIIARVVAAGVAGKAPPHEIGAFHVDRLGGG